MTAGPPPSKGRSLDRDRVRDVVVAGRLRVVVQRRDLELVDAGLDLDRVLAAERVRFHDRRAQGALPARCGALAVAGCAVGLVRRARDDERLAGRREGARQAEDRDDHEGGRREGEPPASGSSEHARRAAESTAGACPQRGPLRGHQLPERDGGGRETHRRLPEEREGGPPTPAERGTRRSVASAPDASAAAFVRRATAKEKRRRVSLLVEPTATPVAATAWAFPLEPRAYKEGEA